MMMEKFKKQIKVFRIVFNKLTPLEREVLRARWGFNFAKEKKLREIAKRKKTSFQRISYIEKSAIKKMEQELKELGFGQFFEK